MQPDGHIMLSDPLFLACILCTLMIPFAVAGLALINVGLNRSRSASHVMLSSLCVASVAMLVFFVCGFSVQGVRGGAACVLHVAGQQWDVMGARPILLHGFTFNQSIAPATFLFSLFSVALVSILPISTGVERWRLAACAASTVLLAGVTYPLFAHWVWGGGWLAQLGANYGLGLGFVDPGGSSCIQVVGSLTALSIAWILGPRQGKFAPDGIPNAMPGHNAVIVLFGCMLAFVGWMGINSAGAILFTGAQPSQLVLVIINTTLAGVSSGLAALLVTRIRFGRPDASLSANGFICGLVASSATSPFVTPVESVVIGMIAGTLVLFAIEWVELHMKIDDPAASISVHGVGGIWGILALGMFAHFSPQQLAAIPGAASHSGSGQFLAQWIGVATLFGFILPLAYVLNWLLNLILPQRVAPEGERQGMDIFELGSGAYPEFSVHHEDFSHL